MQKNYGTRKARGLACYTHRKAKRVKNERGGMLYSVYVRPRARAPGPGSPRCRVERPVFRRHSYPELGHEDRALATAAMFRVNAARSLATRRTG